MIYTIPKTKYIDRIGVEIEGLWQTSVELLKPKLLRLSGWDKNYANMIQGDGSIRFSNTQWNRGREIASSDTNNDGLRELEITTPPLKVGKTIQAIDILTQKLVLTNSSCGFHIHISIKNMDNYIRLTRPDFMLKFVETMTKKFPETKKRLDNSYCTGTYSKGQEAYDIEAQFHDTYKQDTRYRAVNFCYRLHSTVEFRLFPTSKWNTRKDIFARYVLATVEFVEDYLDNLPQKNIVVEKVGTIQDIYESAEMRTLIPLVEMPQDESEVFIPTVGNMEERRTGFYGCDCGLTAIYGNECDCGRIQY